MAVEAKGLSAAQMATGAKLVTALAELDAKRAAILNELEALFAGKPSIGMRLKALREAFLNGWKDAHRGQGYAWNFGKDDQQAKLLLAKLSDAEAIGRVAAYLRDPDPFLSTRGHTFGLFVSSINRYVGQSGPQDLELEAAPADCDHVPACRSDAEHTQKRLLALRS